MTFVLTPGQFTFCYDAKEFEYVVVVEGRHDLHLSLEVFLGLREAQTIGMVTSCVTFKTWVEIHFQDPGIYSGIILIDQVLSSMEITKDE